MAWVRSPRGSRGAGPRSRQARAADGTTHLVFDPLEFLERLAALTPRPRINLLFYYGVLGARAAWRRYVVPSPPISSTAPVPTDTPGARAPVTSAVRGNYLWAELMQRSFGIDVLACPRCGDRLVLIALIEDPWVIQRILAHLGVPTALPAALPARSPPLLRRHDGDEAAASRSASAAIQWSVRQFDPDIDVP